MEILDNGINRLLGSLDGFSAAVQTDEHISAYLGALHGRLSETFDDQMDTFARAAPGVFWHVYESNAIGVPKARLWVHRLSGRGRTRVAGVRFKASKVPVPVNPVLTEPGANGKSVKTGIHVFVWKAPIVEYRLPVRIEPKRGEFLVFAIGDEIVFSRGPIVAVPGQTVGGSFTAVLSSFYGGQAQTAVKRIDARHLRGGKPPVGMLKRGAMKKFSMSASDFNSGQQKARSEMKKRTGNYIAQAMARENIGGEIYD